MGAPAIVSAVISTASPPPPFEHADSPRIVLLVRDLEVGGTERQAAQTAIALTQRGWAVTVVLFYGRGPFVEPLRRAGVRIVFLHKRGRWDTVGFIARLARTLRDLQPQVVYSFLLSPNLAAGVLKPVTRGRLVCGFRSSNALPKRDPVLRLANWLERRTGRLADLVITNSDEGRRELEREGFDPRRLRTVHNGVDLGVFRPDPAGRARVRSEWGVGEAPLVGIVGRITPEKRHDVFLRTAALISERLSDARFVCVGAGPEGTAPLEALAEELGGRVRWAGHRSDMGAVYSALDVLVQTSDVEGFPNVLIEALACGTPCVATDVGDSRLIVGDADLMVPPGQPRAIADAVVTVLDELRSDAGSEGRAKARRSCLEERFSVDASAANTDRLLRGLLS
jgi:glycosyltransferase involved in cell wall biosynthesis